MRMLAMTLAVSAVAAFGIAFAPAAAQQQQAQKGKPVATGPKQRHICKVGPYEKQTRLVMETVANKPVYLAYWSSNGPFHCSFESWPGDGRARWMDTSAGTVINLISGTMLIERNSDKYLIHAREVDRQPYCGTFGTINGILTVPRKGDCDWHETTSEQAGQLRPELPPAADEKPAPAESSVTPAQ
jgi:hypothetical protein